MQALTLQFDCERSSLERYMAEVNRYHVLSREEEQTLARRFYYEGDLCAAHHLVLANLRFVVKVAHEYRGYGLKVLDLIQEGNIGLMIAVKNFNPEKGYRLISYAVWWIRAQIQSFVLRSWSLVKLSGSKIHRKLFFKLRGVRARAEAAAQGQEVVSRQQLAEKLDVGEDDILEMETRLAARDFSLDTALDDSSSTSTTHLDRLTHNTQQETTLSAEDKLVQAQSTHLLQQHIQGILDELNDKERTILEDRLLNDEPKTLADLGSQWGISRERVRQIEHKVIQKLRQRFGNSMDAPQAASTE
jgi:RNA polymerase sigma-32 factor